MHFDPQITDFLSANPWKNDSENVTLAISDPENVWMGSSIDPAKGNLHRHDPQSSELVIEFDNEQERSSLL